MSPENILVVAGETSGDTLGARTIAQWKKINPQISFWGFGGTQMQEQGMEILHTTEELAVIGLSEALIHYRRLKSYAEDLVAQVQKRKTKFVLLIDYPGFNLRLAKRLAEYNIKCHLLVSPQIWAWKYGRIHVIKQYISSVMCLFPFETEIYAKENIEAVFIGHPLTEKVKTSLKKFEGKTDTNPIAKMVNSSRQDSVLILPGSRKNEIARHMDFLLRVARQLHKKYPQLTFIIPAAGEKAELALKEISLPDYVVLVGQNSHAAMDYCHAALACSGTATLECALFQIPFALIYKTSWLTYWVGKAVVRLPYIGMVNVLAKKFVTKEFIQSDMKVFDVVAESERLLFDKPYRENMLNAFKEISNELDTRQTPSLLAARWLNKKLLNKE